MQGEVNEEAMSTKGLCAWMFLYFTHKCPGYFCASLRYWCHSGRGMQSVRLSAREYPEHRVQGFLAIAFVS